MKVLTEKELAVELGLSPWTVRTMRLQKGLPHFRTAGRIFCRLHSVEAWMDNQEKGRVQEFATVTPGTVRRVL